jgi:YVTN family beta-propeller protein
MASRVENRRSGFSFSRWLLTKLSRRRLSPVWLGPVGRYPFFVVITPDGTRAYVTVNGLNIVSVIDTATDTVVANVPVGAFPNGIAIASAPQPPKSKEECKHGGYLKFGSPAGPFKNQGQCVSYVEHH